MFFEAELKGKHFKVNVVEGRHRWKVGIQEEDGDWVHYTIKKRDYQELEQVILFLFKGSSYLLDVVGTDTEYTVYTRGSYRTVEIYNDEMLLHESLKKGGSIGNDSSLTAGMPGKIVRILVEKGQEVKEGEPLVIMEAMKMENEMRASKDVTIKEVHVSNGDSIESGATLISFQ